MAMILPITPVGSPVDIAPLAVVKQWLGIANTNSDAVLQRLITAASRAIGAYCNRAVMSYGIITETRRGTGNRILYLRNFPVLSIISLSILNNAIAQQTSPPFGAGYALDPWDGDDSGANQALRFYGGTNTFTAGVFPRSDASTVITYLAGWGKNEAATVPAGGGSVTVSRPWVADQGVFYAATSAALTRVTGTPALGQYSVASGGVYTFSAADAGANLGIQYGYTPEDLQQALIMMVGEINVMKDRIGIVSKTLGGQETISYSQAAMSKTVGQFLNQYIVKTPIP